MTKPTIYIETSVVSYLTARLSNDFVVAAHQKLTSDWWQQRRFEFELYTSQLITQEARRGDSQAAEQRWRILQNLPLLPVTPEVFELADEFVQKRILPVQAHTDALHIAAAIFHDIDYLLTWNCRHILTRSQVILGNAVSTAPRSVRIKTGTGEHSRYRLYENQTPYFSTYTVIN